MNKKISVGATITLMITAAALAVSITMVVSMRFFDKKIYSINDRQAMYSKLTELDQKIRQNYLGEIDVDHLNDNISEGYLKGIGDKYGRYMSAEEYNKEVESNEGNMVGVGITTIPTSEGNIKVARVMNGSPADVAGMKKGDIITAVDNLLVTDTGYTKGVESIKREVNKKVSLSVTRDGTDMNFDIMCTKFEEQSVESRMIGTKGYIKIYGFNKKTVSQFEDALKSLKEQGATGLIFDVRNNPGGLLDSVSNILDVLLPAGNIVSSTDKDGNKEVLYTSDSEAVNLPMVCITNENSASAAELFACALRDYNKATLVGMTTYGKGTMQKTFVLSDGSAISLSTAYFNPPKSENFEGKGVKPDIEIDLPKDIKPNYYFLSDEEDVQLKKAIEVLSVAATPSGDQHGSESDMPAETNDSQVEEQQESTAA